MTQDVLMSKAEGTLSRFVETMSPVQQMEFPIHHQIILQVRLAIISTHSPDSLPLHLANLPVLPLAHFILVSW